MAPIEFHNLIPRTYESHFADVIKLGSCDKEIILDYLGEPNVTGVLLRGRQDGQSQKEVNVMTKQRKTEPERKDALPLVLKTE